MPNFQKIIMNYDIYIYILYIHNIMHNIINKMIYLNIYIPYIFTYIIFIIIYKYVHDIYTYILLIYYWKYCCLLYHETAKMLAVSCDKILIFCIYRRTHHANVWNELKRQYTSSIIYIESFNMSFLWIKTSGVFKIKH